MPRFVPSSWHLEQQIAAAMAKCDGDVEQTRLREEARQDARADRFIVAQAMAQSRARRAAWWQS